MSARILCRTGDLAGLTREIVADATLGRGPGNDVVVSSALVSTRHARIYREDADYFLEDLGSSNGTRVDGMAVQGRIRLERLHVITLAETIDLIFTRVETAGPDSTSVANPAGSGPRAEKHGMTELDVSSWEELPDLEDAPAERPDPDPVASPRPPAGRGTEMAGPDAWGELPDLSAAEEANREPDAWPEAAPDGGPDQDDPEARPDPAAPADHRPTMMEADFEALPELEQPDASREVEQPVAVPELAVALPGGPLKTFPLKEGDNTIGRSAECDITIIDPDNQVSRKHAVLRVTRDGMTLIDSGSANGTFVDGDRIETATLAAGKSFRLGPHLECTLLQR